MSRYRTYRERDATPEILGDRGFVGVNMRLDPSLLQPGYMAEAINCRFNRGIVETRLGAVFPVWANKASSLLSEPGGMTRVGATAFFFTAGNAFNFYSGQTVSISGFNAPEYNGIHVISVTGPNNINFAVSGAPATPDPNIGTMIGQGTIPWGIIYGVGVFSDPNTFKEYLIVATAAGVYYTSPNNVPYQIPLPSGVSISGPVTFTQAFDRLIMHRGETLTALELKTISSSWTEIVQTPSGTGTEVIPQSVRSLFFQNRLFIPFGNDEVAVSDFNDYTRYVPILQEFRINQGSSDRLVTIEKFNDTSVIAFKEHSIYAVNNVYGSLNAVQLDEITNRFGLVAARSVAHVGSDLWFLSELGVMSIRQTEQNKLQGVAMPISEPIQPLIDRINWRYAADAVAAYWDNKYYLAVPLDDAEKLGDELTLGQFSYDFATGNISIFGLTNGAVYRWVKGANDTSITNGTKTITATGEITVTANYLILVGSLTASVTASLKRLFRGVNNVVLVYDFLNSAWSGYDEANDLVIQDFRIYTVNNRRRLLAICNDSYVRLYEESYEDQLSAPYLDVTVSSTPAVGNTVKVNQGTLITTIAATLNTATQWAIGSPPDLNTARTFFVLSTVDSLQSSYSPFSQFQWNAPSTRPYILPTFGSFRFFSTNGLIPSIVTTGSWATTSSNTTQQITATVTTRQYVTEGMDNEQFSWVTLDLETWNPSYNVDVVMPGENEVFNQVTARTKPRTDWYGPFDKLAFDATNPDGRFMDKYRKDYSLLLGTGGSSGEASSVAVHATSGGINLAFHQAARETFKALNRDTGLQIRLTNTQGRMRLTSVLIEGSKQQINALSFA